MKKKVYDDDSNIHFVTFSCYQRRRILDCDRCRQVVIGVLAQELKKQNGKCLGFVVMPNHVHVLLWFDAGDKLSEFMKIWKGRTSHTLKENLGEWLPNYTRQFALSEPIWQKRYYDFNIHSEDKLNEKLDYMHGNPVRAGLVEYPVAWKHSSLRAYVDGHSVGVAIASWQGLG